MLVVMAVLAFGVVVGLEILLAMTVEVLVARCWWYCWCKWRLWEWC